jgi:putative Holliday junction resolvase
MNNKEDKKQRILGIDYGSKRVGLALSDENGQFAMPLSVIENDDTLMEKIRKIALDNEIGVMVMGESRNYDGKPNSILLDSITLKENLEAEGYIVHFEPEFMTSVQAERFQGKTDMLDASAAALILQSYLDRDKESELN